MKTSAALDSAQARMRVSQKARVSKRVRTRYGKKHLRELCPYCLRDTAVNYDGDLHAHNCEQGWLPEECR